MRLPQGRLGQHPIRDVTRRPTVASQSARWIDQRIATQLQPDRPTFAIDAPDEAITELSPGGDVGPVLLSGAFTGRVVLDQLRQRLPNELVQPETAPTQLAHAMNETLRGIGFPKPVRGGRQVVAQPGLALLQPVLGQHPVRVVDGEADEASNRAIGLDRRVDLLDMAQLSTVLVADELVPGLAGADALDRLREARYDLGRQPELGEGLADPVTPYFAVPGILQDVPAVEITDEEGERQRVDGRPQAGLALGEPPLRMNVRRDVDCETHLANDHIVDDERGYQPLRDNLPFYRFLGASKAEGLTGEHALVAVAPFLDALGRHAGLFDAQPDQVARGSAILRILQDVATFGVSDPQRMRNAVDGRPQTSLVCFGAARRFLRALDL
ncbi:MAG: hypothetical protein R3C69_18420, partial [Geminicoccaceae bacterium]